MDTQCTHCFALAYMPQYIRPAICEKHLNIVMVITQLEREKRLVTVRSVQVELERYFNLQIENQELRQLLYQLRRVVVGNAYFLATHDFLFRNYEFHFNFPREVEIYDYRPSGDAHNIYRVEIYWSELPEDESGPYQVKPIYSTRIVGSHTEPVFLGFEILSSGVRVEALDA